MGTFQLDMLECDVPPDMHGTVITFRDWHLQISKPLLSGVVAGNMCDVQPLPSMRDMTVVGAAALTALGGIYAGKRCLLAIPPLAMWPLHASRCLMWPLVLQIASGCLWVLICTRHMIAWSNLVNFRKIAWSVRVMCHPYMGLCGSVDEEPHISESVLVHDDVIRLRDWLNVFHHSLGDTGKGSEGTINGTGDRVAIRGGYRYRGERVGQMGSVEDGTCESERGVCAALRGSAQRRGSHTERGPRQAHRG